MTYVSFGRINNDSTDGIAVFDLEAGEAALIAGLPRGTEIKIRVNDHANGGKTINLTETILRSSVSVFDDSHSDGIRRATVEVDVVLYPKDANQD